MRVINTGGIKKMNELNFGMEGIDEFATGEWLRAKRQELGLNQKTLAGMAEVLAQDVAQAESGVPYVRPKLAERLKASCKALMVTLFQLCRARNVPLEMISAEHITGADIRKAREATGMSQSALARMLKLRSNDVSQVELDAIYNDSFSSHERVDGIKRRLAAHFNLHKAIGEKKLVEPEPELTPVSESPEATLISVISNLSDAVSRLETEIRELRRMFE